MMGDDVRYHSDLNPDRHFVFLGKAAIYSAGTTFMSFFAAGNRYLTRGTRLMIHERKLNKTCCSPRTIGHGQGFPRAAMNSRGERYPRALCGCTSL